MRSTLFVLLQILLILPITAFASGGAVNPVAEGHAKGVVTGAQKTAIVRSYGNLPLYFIKNNGQVDGQVSFYEKGAGHATFFTQDGVVLSLTKRDGRTKKANSNKGIPSLTAEKPAKAITEAVTLSFVGANEKAKITAGDAMPGHVNYFVGNDKTKWRSNVPTYGAVTYKDVYKNINIKFYGTNKNIEHDVIVRPGGDFSKVIFAYNGVQGLKVTEAGDLEVSLDGGKIIERKPVIYQEIKGERVAVEGSYRILKAEDGVFTYGFNVAAYDRTKDLVIDPVLVYSTFLGGINNDQGMDIAIDNTGSAYVVGDTAAPRLGMPAFNLIPGAIGGMADVFVTKINPAGSAFVYSTLFGGSTGEESKGIAVDNTGAAYVTGVTQSTDFPLMNPIQGVLSGFFDAFITKISPDGAALVYSTYLGGSGSDTGEGIAVDNSTGLAYVTGGTDSSDFPLMFPWQGVFSGGFGDAFVSAINPAGSTLLYSTYLGGTGWEGGYDIAVDSARAVYVVGRTFSTDFTLLNPIQATAGGGADTFVAKLGLEGFLAYSTYLGGTGWESGAGIAVDSSGAAFITGETLSTDFPLMNPIQAASGGGPETFITKINPAGTALVYSTYLGGSSDDSGNSIAVDSAGAAYITGTTGSTDFPLMNPVQGTIAGFQDAFVAEINPAGTALVYSTFLGGSGSENGNGIAVDSSGAAYVTGGTGVADPTNFPLMNPVQGVFGGGASDAFISKIDVIPPPTPVVTLTLVPDATFVSPGFTLGFSVTVTNTTAVEQCFQYWENVNLPGGALYPAQGALMGPIRLCLAGGVSQAVHQTRGVPLSAPLGAYAFNSYLGIYPIPYRVVVDSASFNFNVIAGGVPAVNPRTSWRIVGKGFRR